ncbi:hypothetical protein Dimus_008753 [Dionaea muscipula]
MVHMESRLQRRPCKVVSTTRNPHIVSALGDEHVLYHEPQLLDIETSWKLLQKTAFPDEIVMSVDLEQLGKKMLEHCKGLPLAVVVLGGVLANKRTADDWKNVLDNIRSYFGADDNSVYDVLGMSYYDLPVHLKPCFLHLGIFPEDFEMPVDRLYRMWMVERIVPVDRKTLGGKSSEEVAEGYLNELVERRMVQAAKVTSQGKVRACRLHDLIRDVSMAIGREENFVSVIDHIHGQSDEEPAPTLDNERLHRLSLYVGQDVKSSLSYSLSRNAPNLRSLLFFQVHETEKKSSNKFIEDICSEHKLLRVLELEGLNIKGDLPRKVGNLIYLRYLNLSGTHATSLPSSISNLMCLETLDLRVSCVVIKLPNLLWKLKRLRHLYLPRQYEIKNDEMLRLDGLNLLETLKGVDIDKVELKGLLGLRKLRKLSANCFSNKKNMLLDMVSFLNSPKIKHLSLSISGSLFNQDHMILSKCQSLQKLDIVDEITAQLQPEMFPKSLVNLGFVSTKLSQDSMPILEHRLPLLEKMRLIGPDCVNLRHMICSAAGFPELTDLVIRDLPSLVEWRMEQGAMPKLRSLEIFQTGIKKLPDALPKDINITCNPCVPGIERFGTCPYFKNALSAGRDPFSDD